jgi:NADH-quinone oxidoreductase subunit L
VIPDFPPGLLFVVATLLPLASFVLLLVWGGLRWTLRPYAKQGGPAALAFDALGGETGGRAPAIVATAAIALACACSVAGFALFWMDHRDVEDELKPLHAAIKAERSNEAKAEGKAKTKSDKKIIGLHAKAERIEGLFEERWAADMPWAGVLPRVAPDPGIGTAAEPGNGMLLRVGYRIDMLAALMFVMVTFIATLIHLFSMGYMADELKLVVEDHEVHDAHGHYHRRGRFGRFFMFLSLFCFSMLNLLLADNLFQVFVSWELVGVCSFLLIGFYFERQSASNAANKAFIVNRVGDAGFIIGLMILWTHVGTFNFQELFARIRWPLADAHHLIPADYVGQFAFARRGEATKEGYETQALPPRQSATDVLVLPRGEIEPEHPGHRHWHFEQEPAATLHPDAEHYGYMPYWMLVLAGLGIFLGCVGKSAQFPLHVWLPDAMEGPTPVSALIHAATMVAAGVYLVARCYPLFLPEVLLVIAYTGAITLFVAATVALVMTDIKKVLAYSTVSQLGYMMLALGVGGWVAGSFHLITHAFFKALLFLGSGSVIYGCHHQQDMLKMGGLYPKMKITAITMLLGVLAICGVPLFAGWYSKDAILVSALSFADNHREHFLLFALPLVTAALTTFYMFRMWFMTFTGTPRDAHVYAHAHEAPWLMTVPLIVLAFFSVFIAWGLPPWEAHESQLAHQIEHSQPASVAADFGRVADEAVQMRAGYHETAGGLALLMVVLGLAFAGALYYKNLLDPADAKAQFPGVHRFLSHKWYFDEFYSAAFVRPTLVVSGWVRAFDTHVIDGAVNLVGRLGLLTSRWSGRADRNVVDGLANVIGNASYAIAAWLRTLQTGYLRSYVLFLALAAIAIWILLVSLFGVAIGSQ